MRESGILMPVSSLPGPYGIGCFGAEALKFVDFLAAAGQHIWQLLPLSPTGYGDSPYQSCSAFAGNPYFIDLDALKADGLLTAAQLKAEKWGDDPLSVDYGTLYTSRYKVLRTAYAAWREKYAGLHGCAHYYPDDYYAFALANDSWLNDYALYMALKTANGMKSWTEWPREYRLRDAAALAKFAAEQEEEIGFWKFLQYEFATQWKKVKDYANAKGVKILGDIPIYVSADSVDAWVGGELFELDAQGGFARVAGCPPDYFSADGQLWGNPLYNWPYHKQTGYAWWIRRVRHALGIYDLLREPGFPCIHLGRRIIVPRDAMIDWLENRLQEELNSAAKSRESNEVSVIPEAVSEADTDLPETQVREDGVYIKVLPRDMKKPQAI